MEWQKKYHWSRTWGKETGLNGLPHEDFVGWDGDVQIGRIYLDQQTLKAGRYYWAIQYPKGGKPFLPNFGWETTAAEAAKVVEDLWDVQKARLEP
jgi:hypothetical protein